MPGVLPQPDRNGAMTDEEQNKFSKGLRAINLLYGSPRLLVWSWEPSAVRVLRLGWQQ